MRFCFSFFRTDPAEYVELAQVAEEFGWDTALVSDHVVNPATIHSRYPYNETGERTWQNEDDFPDVWVATGMMAAATKRLHFMQGVYILPLRHPFLVAKALGTAAYMSNYRVSLGIGLGWMRDEFELMDQDFATRGARCDEMVEVMRQLWTGEMVSHDGRFYRFPPLNMRPAASGPIPIVIGGSGDPAQRRAARIGDGWAPAGLEFDALRDGLQQIQKYRAEAGRDRLPFSVYGMARGATTASDYRRFEEIGLTHALAMPWDHGDPSQDLESKKTALKRFADKIIAPLS